ncbi:hypothetical protein MUY14_06360 [Amycolatopsis sp. FBCC-B4732]|uniref:hypothetical protein n=1 Tax=Amycolatopsis sp. FBCC-B4732 TaxID=3079339 RepID=UPI001FF47A60|nr:hypothetical protein [Amycolatopsis sp. FBCC-B4732]UOX90246.1 hypothetical protein MUY14_06360 [Amycolatopsis sp. FBCC-B4732]
MLNLNLSDHLLTGHDASAASNAGQHGLDGFFSGGEPPGLGNEGMLTTLSEDNIYFRGTAVQVLGSRWRLVQSGLIIPEYMAQLPAPLDQVLTYLDPDEIFGYTPPVAFLHEQVRRLTVEMIIVNVAAILAVFRKPGAKRNQVDKRFASMWFSEPTKTRVLNLLRDPSRGLVVPQALYALIQCSMRFSGDSLLPGVTPGNFIAASLVINAYLDNDSVDLEEGQIIDDVPGGLGREMISNQLFNSGIDEVNILARFYRMWLQMSTESDTHPEVLNLEEGYREIVGIELRDVLAIGLVLFSSCVNEKPVLDVAYLKGIPWEDARLQKVLDFMAIDIPGLRGEILGEIARASTTWSFGSLSRYPVVKLWNGSIVVIDSTLLLPRFFGWLPVFDIKFNARSKQHKALADKLVQSLRRLSERYVAEVLDSLASSLEGLQRVYHDEHLKQAYSAKGVKVADAAIDYGTSWVVVEVTTSQLKRESVYGVSDQAVVEDLMKLVGEVEQIDSTIRSLRHDEQKLTGFKVDTKRTFYPLLVTTEGFPVNPISLTLVRKYVEDAGLLAGDDVAPLEIVDVIELEIVEGVQEAGGPGLAELLEQKRNASLWRSSLRDYILVEKKLRPPRPERIEDLWRKASNELIKRSFGGQEPEVL